MPRPDTTAATPRRPRDPRIDAFRGLALVMIFVDHVPGNPYEVLTIRNWGFSDAAESFFVMSGIAAGLAYSGRFLPRTGGLWPAMRPMWKRAWTLYLVHIALTLCAIAIFATGARLFWQPEFLSLINLKAVFQSPEQAAIGIPLLGHQLGYVNILPAYSVLLLAGPAAILLGLKRPWLLAAVSVALWLAAGIWRLNLPNYPNPGGWFFNPVAWQLVFVIGLLIGIHLRRGARFVPVSSLLLVLAVFWLVLSFVWSHSDALAAILNHQMARLSAAGLPFTFVSHDKTFLALPRLLHVLALVYVLSCSPLVLRACAHPLAEPLRILGRHGLLVFSVGTVIALMFQVIMAGYPDMPLLGITLPLIGLMLQLAVGRWAERHKRPPVAQDRIRTA